jgi:hypothetical protein
MLMTLYDRNTEINKNAGRLPIEAVVVAKRVLDAVREIVDTSQVHELDMRVVSSLRGILDDYLPTTVRAYLALDPATVYTPHASGTSAAQSVVEQLETLWESAEDLLAATRADDVDALETQGRFLRTKFSRSDLDI